MRYTASSKKAQKLLYIYRKMKISEVTMKKRRSMIILLALTVFLTGCTELKKKPLQQIKHIQKQKQQKQRHRQKKPKAKKHRLHKKYSNREIFPLMIQKWQRLIQKKSKKHRILHQKENCLFRNRHKKSIC